MGALGMNEIVKFTSDAGAAVQLTPDDIRKYVCESATEKEVGLFLAHCAAHRLDPIGSKDAYLVKYGSSPASIITGYQVFNRRARKSPDYAGIKSGVVTLRPDGTVQRKQGSAIYKAVDGELIGGWAEVYVKGWEAPAYCEVALSDYSTGKSNWAKMPGVMIEKVAKAAAWRLAYPDEFSGMYIGEEMEQAQQAPRQQRREQPVQVDAVVEPQRPSVLQPLRDRMRAFAEACGESMGQAAGHLLDFAGVASLDDLDEEGVRQTAEYMDGIIAAKEQQEEIMEVIG